MKWTPVRPGLQVSGDYKLRCVYANAFGYITTSWVVSYKGNDVRRETRLAGAKREAEAFAAQLAKGLVTETGEPIQPVKVDG